MSSGATSNARCSNTLSSKPNLSGKTHIVQGIYSKQWLHDFICVETTTSQPRFWSFPSNSNPVYIRSKPVCNFFERLQQRRSVFCFVQNEICIKCHLAELSIHRFPNSLLNREGPQQTSCHLPIIPFLQFSAKCCIGYQMNDNE